MTIEELRAYCAEHAETIFVRAQDSTMRWRSLRFAELLPSQQEAWIRRWHADDSPSDRRGGTPPMTESPFRCQASHPEFGQCDLPLDHEAPHEKRMISRMGEQTIAWAKEPGGLVGAVLMTVTIDEG